MSMEYNCDICNKNYKTYQTLWKHNKNFHNITSSNTLNNYSNTPKITSKILNNYSELLFNCLYCNKTFNSCIYCFFIVTAPFFLA